MEPIRDEQLGLTRRQLFGRTSKGIGVAGPRLAAESNASPAQSSEERRGFGGLADLPHFAPTAKRVIYLHQSGAPSQIDLFDYKPKLMDIAGTELPDSVRQGQRITGMTSGQNSLPVAPSIFKFRPRRRERNLDQRTASAHRQDRGRHHAR